VREGSIIEWSNEGEIMALFPLVVAAALAPRKGSLGPNIHFWAPGRGEERTSCRLVNATNRVAKPSARTVRTVSTAPPEAMGPLLRLVAGAVAT
jgi:hypothetical protein